VYGIEEVCHSTKKNSVLLNGHEGWTLVIESLVVMGLKKEKT
jgi:hypothetical protein